MINIISISLYQLAILCFYTILNITMVTMSHMVMLRVSVLTWDVFGIILVWLIPNVQKISTSTLFFSVVTVALPVALDRWTSSLRNRPYYTVTLWQCIYDLEITTHFIYYIDWILHYMTVSLICCRRWWLIHRRWSASTARGSGAVHDSS